MNDSYLQHIMLEARERVLLKKNRNLNFLLQQRYEWIAAQIKPHEKGLELGAGAGHSKMFLQDYEYATTEKYNWPWIEIPGRSAIDTGLPDASFDYIFAVNVLHHVDKPIKMLGEAQRLLKPGGRLILIDAYSSLLFRFVMRLIYHEHCNEKVDVFSPGYSLSRLARTSWDGNNSTAKLMFSQTEKLKTVFPDFTLTHMSHYEVFLFLNSGGVYRKTPCLPLPERCLKRVLKLDGFLAGRFPKTCALALRIVLEKSPDFA